MPKRYLSATDANRIADILVAIEHIKRYCRSVSESKFLLEPQIQDSVIRRLTIIGEAASKLSPEAKRGYSGIPWTDMIGMRHILVHDYGRSEILMLWRTVKNDLPTLEKALRKK